MSLPNQEWESTYPTTQDVDPLSTGTQQPDNINETFPEAGDGHNVRVSHVHTLRDKLQEMAKVVGDDSHDPTGCLREKVAALEAAPPAHAGSHQNGQPDEISVAGLSGVLADPQTPATHAGTHANGQPDEINVSGLSGLLADDQNPVNHAADHQSGQPDEISVAGLSGLLADDQNPVNHASDHQNGQPDEISVAGLSGVLADYQVANKLRETGGPATLDIGAIVDGEFLKRVGTDIVSAAAAGGGFSGREEEFTATGGDENFTLAATPATNANMLSGVNIIGVFMNGVRSRYQASPTLQNEYGYTAPTTINCKALPTGAIVTVVYSE